MSENDGLVDLDGTDPAQGDTSEPGGTGDPALAGLGVDIVEIARFEQILERTPHFRMRVYTEAERAYCDSKVNPAVHYALFFAAKEAVLKALGTGFRGMGINDVEVAHNRFGKPIAVLSGNALEEARRQGIHEVYLSLSYTHTTGVASAVAARKEHIPEKRTVEDAETKIAEQFKSMRAMLDEIDAKLTEIEQSGVVGEAAGSPDDGAGQAEGDAQDAGQVPAQAIDEAGAVEVGLETGEGARDSEGWH